MSIETLIRQRAAGAGYGRSVQDALVGIGHHESSLNPRALGDGGTSYGLFQLHRNGGVLGSMSDAQARSYFDPRRNVDFVLRALKSGRIVHNGMTTAQAVDAISRRFERPANPTAEIAGALAFLRRGGSSAGFPTSTASSSPTSPFDASQSSSPFDAAAPTTPDPAFQIGLNAAKANQKLLNLPFIRLPDVGGSIPMRAQLDQGVTAPPPIAGVGGAIAAAAKNFLGIQYVWGGNTPKQGFDCSGLTKFVLAKFGVTIPRVAADQFNAGRSVQQSQARPGDLIFFRHADGTVGHVGIMLGGGKFLHAPRRGDVVKISNLAGYGLPVAGLRRFAR